MIGTTLGDRHQVEPVHEVDEIHEPEAREQKQGAFDPERAGRNDPKIAGRGNDHGGDRQRLQQEPRQDRNGVDVVGKAYDSDEQRRAENRDGNFQACRADKTRSTAAATISVAAITAMPGALRRRNAMRRARVRLRQCDAAAAAAGSPM